MQRKLLFMVGLALIAMGVTDCTLQQNQQPEPTPAVAYSTTIDVSVTGDNELYVADVLWRWETAHPIQFGNFEEKTITVAHYTEDAYAYIVLDRVPKPEDFTLLMEPPVPGAKVVEILTRRRWPVPDPELPDDDETE